MMDTYCRTCSGQDNNSRIYALSTMSQISSVQIDDMLVYCTQLETTAEDHLPQQICFNCFMSLNSAFEFRKLCYKSVVALQNTLQNIIQEDVDQTTDQCSTDVMIKQESIELDDLTITILGDIDTGSVSDDLLQKHRKKYLCKECDFSTNSANMFKRHKNRKHPVRTRKAEKACSRVKRTRTIYKCGDCVFQNYSATKLSAHQTSKGHTKSTTYQGVLSLGKLDEKKPYPCPYCGSRFSYKQNVNKHMQVACRVFHNKKGIAEEFNARSNQLVVPTIKTCDEFRLEYCCAKCSQVFARKSTYLRHKRQIQCSQRMVHILPYRCDFCNYSSCRRLNLYRHQIAMCKDEVYLDETSEPQHLFNDTLKNVYNGRREIEALKLESGKPIFATEYPTEEDDINGMLRPPIPLIVSVEEFEYFFVIKMRGLRCCACSRFFQDKEALDEHRRTVHLLKVCKSTDEKTDICENCRLLFYRSDSFNYHKQLEKTSGLLFCTTCEVMVIGNTAWLVHRNTHHGKRNFDDSYEKVIVGEKF